VHLMCSSLVQHLSRPQPACHFCKLSTAFHSGPAAERIGQQRQRAASALVFELLSPADNPFPGNLLGSAGAWTSKKELSRWCQRLNPASSGLKAHGSLSNHTPTDV
jgi:hypothetical protein